MFYKNTKRFDNFLENLKDVNIKRVDFGIVGDKANLPASQGSKKHFSRITIGHLANIIEHGISYSAKRNFKFSVTSPSGEIRWIYIKKGQIIRNPARPFIKQSINALRGNIKPLMINELKSILNQQSSSQNLFENIGTHSKEIVKQTIKSHNFALLSDLQIFAKGNNTPLIQSGKLIDSIDFEVRNK